MNDSESIEAEEEILPDARADGQGVLSPAASFVTARESSSSRSSSSSSISYPPSVTLTPLDWRTIGRDIEERPSFSWLNSPYEEFYGRPQPTGASRTMAEQGASSAHLLSVKASAPTGVMVNPPVQPRGKRITLKILPQLGPGLPSDKGRAKALMKAVTGIKGVDSCSFDRGDNTLVIIGTGLDPLLVERALRKKSPIDIMSVEPV